MSRIPNLNVRPQDIISTLNDCLRMQLSEEDLAKPQPMRMIAVYELLITTCMGVPTERFAMPSYKALQHMEHPNIHDESLLEIQLYKRKFLRAIGIDDFSLRDILRPEPARVKRILGITTAYIKHRSEQMSYFQKVSADYEKLLSTRSTLEAENAKQLKRLETLKLQREQEESIVVKAQEANARHEREIQECIQRKEQNDRDFEDIRRRRDGLVAKNDNLKLLNKSCQEHIDKTKSKIVTNPEELKQVLVSLRRSIEEEKGLEEEAKNKMRSLNAKGNMMETLHNELKSLDESLRECEAKKQEVSNSRKQLDISKEVLDRGKQELRDSTVRLQTCIKQVAVAKDRIKRLKVSCDPKVQQMTDKVHRMEREHDKTKREVNDLHQRSDEFQIVVQDCTQHIQDLTRDAEAELAGLANDFGQLRMQVDQYLSELIRGLQGPLGVSAIVA